MFFFWGELSYKHFNPKGSSTNCDYHFFKCIFSNKWTEQHPLFSEIFGRWSEISFEGLGSFEGRRPRWNDIPKLKRCIFRFLFSEKITPKWERAWSRYSGLRNGILDEKGLWLQHHVSKTIQAAQKIVWWVADCWFSADLSLHRAKQRVGWGWKRRTGKLFGQGAPSFNYFVLKHPNLDDILEWWNQEKIIPLSTMVKFTESMHSQGTFWIRTYIRTCIWT